MKSRTALLFFSLLMTASALMAQESFKLINQIDLRIKERQLISLGDSILKGSNDSIRIASGRLFNDEMGILLSHQNTFSNAFDSLTSVSILNSKDGLIKIYTWILPASDRNSYSYFGYVQFYNKKTKLTITFKLSEIKYENEQAMMLALGTDNWYGALYYKMIEKKNMGKTSYTLLGWHGNNRLTTKKVIDILSIQNDTLVFGKTVFTGDGKPKRRMVFEFTANAVMKLNYDERKKLIVFDHLSPAAGAEKNQFEFYGPDFRYDGLQFKKGNWVLKKDLDIRNPKSLDAREGKKNSGKSLYDSGK